MKKEIKKFLDDTGIKTDDKEIEGFHNIYEKLVEAKRKITGEREYKSFNKVVKIFADDAIENKLFPNKIPRDHFGMPAIFSDNYSIAMDKVETQKDRVTSVLQQYIGYQGATIPIIVDNKGQLGFKFDNEIRSIKNEDIDSIFDVIKNTIQDGVILQHYCALWNYAVTKQKSFKFAYVKIDKVLETFLKKPSNGYFRHETRQRFTKSIRTLQKMKIRIPIKSKQDSKAKNEFINLPLLDFALSTENKDGTVMLNFIGTLMNSNQLNSRGRIFPEGIFELDARTESHRVSLAFKLATRFDQQNQKPVIRNRAKLIKDAGLEKTEGINPSQASIFLEKTLQRLKEVKCISDYQEKKIGNNNGQKITLFSPLHKGPFLQ